MYPRLSSQSRLWEGMGSWDALVSMPFSEISAAGSICLYTPQAVFLLFRPLYCGILL